MKHPLDFEPAHNPIFEELVERHARNAADYAAKILSQVYEILAGARAKLDVLPPLGLPDACTWANDPRSYANQVHELAVEVSQTKAMIESLQHLSAVRDELMGDIREGEAA
jgi:hypothetical protein